MNDRQPGQCGATLQDAKNYVKRNANGKTDGGRYASQIAKERMYMQLYGCDNKCLRQKTANGGPTLASSTSKSSKGTCLNWATADGTCVANNPGGNAANCAGCAGIFNFVAPDAFASQFTIGTPAASTNLNRSITRVQSAGPPEALSNPINSDGADLAEDDTAKCMTTSSFECPGEDKDFAAMADAGKCKEKESTKIDKMCDDGPCDNDPLSNACAIAKAKCEVDPESGVKCMPQDNENDPCAGCIRTFSGGEAAAVTFTSALVFAALL